MDDSAVKVTVADDGVVEVRIVLRLDVGPASPGWLYAGIGPGRGPVPRSAGRALRRAGARTRDQRGHPDLHGRPRRTACAPDRRALQGRAAGRGPAAAGGSYGVCRSVAAQTTDGDIAVELDTLSDARIMRSAQAIRRRRPPARCGLAGAQRASDLLRLPDLHVTRAA